MSNTLKQVFQFSTYVFAIVGLVLVLGFLATNLGLTDTSGIIDTQQGSFLANDTNSFVSFPLEHTPEWISFRVAVAKDKTTIEQVSRETGIPSRILVTILVPEQMRLFHSNRAIFKEVFQPLKILGSQSQFSWGIHGIKEETARAVERHLLDKNSPYYLGQKFEHSLDFNTDSPERERFSRITDEHNHIYGYRYVALYISQIEEAWRRAGFDISHRPDILATLWNIGFEKSVPKATPKTGGSSIDIDGTIYSFGSLAGAFYYSDEMIEVFPVL